MLEPWEKEFISGIEEEVKNSKIGLLGFAIIFLVVFSFIFSWVFALRRVFRYKGVNKEMFNAAFAYLDDLVYNHTIEQQNQKEN